MTEFAKNVVRNELVLHQADSANVQLDSAELDEMHSKFTEVVSALWDQLGVTPKSLADSGKTPAERERIAATRVNQYLDKLMTQQASYIAVPPPIEELLRAKYAWTVNDAALDAATDQAAKEKAKTDSAAAKNRPPSEVPLGAPAAPAKSDTGKKKP